MYKLQSNQVVIPHDKNLGESDQQLPTKDCTSKDKSSPMWICQQGKSKPDAILAIRILIEIFKDA